jgi:hypothetical protein
MEVGNAYVKGEVRREKEAGRFGHFVYPWIFRLPVTVDALSA